MTETSGELRRRLRQVRRSRTPAVRLRADEDLAAHLRSLPELEAGGRLATYMPSDGELDPNLVVDVLRARGWKVFLPVIGPERSMRFAEWRPDGELVPNRYGIPEPVVGGDGGLEPADRFDVILVPSVAVDVEGNRLGMGAGFYDRALAPASGRGRPVLVGVVHDEALLDGLVSDPWDVPLDVVVSERRVVRPGGRPPGR